MFFFLPSDQGCVGFCFFSIKPYQADHFTVQYFAFCLLDACCTHTTWTIRTSEWCYYTRCHPQSKQSRNGLCMNASYVTIPLFLRPIYFGHGPTSKIASVALLSNLKRSHLATHINQPTEKLPVKKVWKGAWPYNWSPIWLWPLQYLAIVSCVFKWLHLPFALSVRSFSPCFRGVSPVLLWWLDVGMLNCLIPPGLFDIILIIYLYNCIYNYTVYIYILR